jgi:small subunit ribosomal protein S6
METVVTKRLYEGMFLIDSAEAANWDATIAALEKVLKRVDAEIVSMRKWDERRLAYEIDGKSRGTYILCYFRADGEKIRDIEKAVHLSEDIMRVLILSAEQMTPEDLEKDTPAGKMEKETAAREAARAAKTEQEGSENEAAEAGEVEPLADADVAEESRKAEEAWQAQAPQAEQDSDKSQKPDSSAAAEGSDDAGSEQTKQEDQ